MSAAKAKSMDYRLFVIDVHENFGNPGADNPDNPDGPNDTTTTTTTITTQEPTYWRQVTLAEFAYLFKAPSGVPPSSSTDFCIITDSMTKEPTDNRPACRGLSPR
jgi:hypothetical protein